MKHSDDMKFAEIMATIGAAFSKPLTDIQLDIYFDCLKEYPIDDIVFAAKNIIKSRTITGTFPLISEFISVIESKSGSINDKAELAWLALVYAIETVSGYGSVQFEDPVIHDTVAALGGWIKITNADNPDWNNDKQLQWRRKDFVSLYKIMAKHAGRSVPYLIGIHEAENKGTYDDFVPKITHIGGKPGQYITCQVDDPRQLPEYLQDMKLIESVVQKCQA